MIIIMIVWILAIVLIDFLGAGSIFRTRNLLNWLYRCVDNMEGTSRKLYLAIECLDAYRKRVKENPSYYIKTFVLFVLCPQNNGQKEKRQIDSFKRTYWTNRTN